MTRVGAAELKFRHLRREPQLVVLVSLSVGKLQTGFGQCWGKKELAGVKMESGNFPRSREPTGSGQEEPSALSSYCSVHCSPFGRATQGADGEA